LFWINVLVARGVCFGKSLMPKLINQRGAVYALAATVLFAYQQVASAADGGKKNVSTKVSATVANRKVRPGTRAAGAVATKTAVAGTAIRTNSLASPPLAFPSEEAKVRHLLNRVTYGPSTEDLDRVMSIGIDKYIDEQLKPESITLPAKVAALAKQPALSESPARLFLNYGKEAFDDMAKAARKTGPDGKGTDAAVKKEIQQLVRDNYQDLYGQVSEARLTRATDSPRQLEEVMTEFWFNHFNVSMDKGLDHLWVGSYEEAAIRPNVFGKFRELLGATAHHAAMLFYLDNWQNTAPKLVVKPKGANKKFAGLNENYARELMELHTLGVDGGYTQKDVVELARVLTGHGLITKKSIITNPAGLNSKYGYNFDQSRHDFGDKVLLGQTIKAKGVEELEEALDMLAKHPSTAKFVSYKLAQYFICDDPPPTLVTKLSNTFQKTDGDLKVMMRTLLKSDEFWDARQANAKFKSPYRYLVSGLRASNATVNNTRPLLGFLRLQGMPMYQCQTPDGYKNTQKAWLSSSGLLQRINFATAFGANRSPGARISDVSPEQVMRIAGIKPTDQTGQVVESSPRQLKLALLFGSPEFMKY